MKTSCEKGSFRNVLNKFQIRGITVLILLSKSVRLHGDRLRRSRIKFIRDARIGGCCVALGHICNPELPLRRLFIRQYFMIILMQDTEHPFQLMFPLKFIVFVYPKFIQASLQLNLKHYVMTPFSLKMKVVGNGLIHSEVPAGSGYY